MPKLSNLQEIQTALQDLTTFSSQSELGVEIDKLYLAYLNAKLTKEQYRSFFEKLETVTEVPYYDFTQSEKEQIIRMCDAQTDPVWDIRREIVNSIEIK